MMTMIRKKSDHRRRIRPTPWMLGAGTNLDARRNSAARIGSSSSSSPRAGLARKERPTTASLSVWGGVRLIGTRKKKG